VRLDEVRQQAIAQLKTAGYDLASAQFDSQRLLEHLLSQPASWLFAHPEATLTRAQHIEFEALIQQRVQGVPVAYLTGEVGFWDLQLWVNESTLIPRPDTELMVSTALNLMAQAAQQPIRVLDLGTGTGAIALALARERPLWQVRGYDRALKAVELARSNAERHGLMQVTFACHDWYDTLPQWPCDLMLSNPPYIAANDPHLAQGDVRFEPLTALVAADAGMADLRQVIDCAQRHLRVGGYLLLEHGFQQGEAVSAALQTAGFSNVLIEHDLQGHWRLTGAQWLGS
jgi:release factor glutamine methyltransferase